jgi:hypothetical protein
VSNKTVDLSALSPSHDTTSSLQTTINLLKIPLLLWWCSLCIITLS